MTLPVTWKAQSTGIHRELYSLHCQSKEEKGSGLEIVGNLYARECNLLSTPPPHCDGTEKRLQGVSLMELSLKFVPLTWLNAHLMLNSLGMCKDCTVLSVHGMAVGHIWLFNRD